MQSFGCCDLRIGSIVYGAILMVPCFFTCLVCIHNLVKANTKYSCANESNLTSILSLVIAILGYFANGFLIYGSCKKSKYFLVPWLVLSYTLTIIITIQSLIWMFSFAFALWIVLFTVVLWYLWYGVLSFYKSLDTTNSNVAILMVPNVTPAQNPEPYSLHPPPYSCVTCEDVKSPGAQPVHLLLFLPPPHPPPPYHSSEIRPSETRPSNPSEMSSSEMSSSEISSSEMNASVMSAPTMIASVMSAPEMYPSETQPSEIDPSDIPPPPYHIALQLSSLAFQPERTGWTIRRQPFQPPPYDVDTSEDQYQPV